MQAKKITVTGSFKVSPDHDKCVYTGEDHTGAEMRVVCDYEMFDFCSLFHQGKPSLFKCDKCREASNREDTTHMENSPENKKALDITSLAIEKLKGFGMELAPVQSEKQTEYGNCALRVSEKLYRIETDQKLLHALAFTAANEIQSVMSTLGKVPERIKVEVQQLCYGNDEPIKQGMKNECALTWHAWTAEGST